MRELLTHFEEKIAELRQKGINEKDATRMAIDSFGRARAVARLMYEAYSKGDWFDAATAALPHLIIAGLFATHLWHYPILAPLVLLIIVGVTVLGWWHGTPNWLYSWIGYAFVPLLIAGYELRFVLLQTASFFLGEGEVLPDTGLLLVVGVLICFSLWIIIRTTVRVIKRDWVLASLLLLPLPLVGGWLVETEPVGGIFGGAPALLQQWDAALGLAFVVLASASVIFIRLRQRTLKAGVIMVVGAAARVIAGPNPWGGSGLGLFVVFLLSLGFLFAPAVIDARLGHGGPGVDAWRDADLPGHSSSAK